MKSTLRKQHLLVLFFLFLSFTASSSVNFTSGFMGGYVKGNVVDEYGHELYDVKVEAYEAATGNRVARVYTSTTGYFKLSVPNRFRAYNLRFVKKGYVTKTMEVYVGFEQTVNLGSIILQKILMVYSTVLGRTVETGYQLLIPFTVESRSETRTVITFNLTAPEDWDAKIIDESGQVTKVSLPSGGSLSLNLKAAVPKDALGAYNLTLTAIADERLGSTLEFAITVEPAHRTLQLWTMTPVQITTAGSTVDFDVEIQNLAAQGCVFYPSLNGLPTGWKATFFNGEEQITCLALKSGASATLVVNIEISEIGEEGIYPLNFTVSTIHFSEGIELQVILEPIERRIEMKSLYTSLTTEAGDTATYDITVTNEGDKDEFIHFSTNTTSPDLDVTFSAMGAEVAAGGSLSLSVTVATRRGITPGEYTVPIIAETEDGEVSDSVTLKLQVKGAYRLTLRLTPLNIRVTAGEEYDAIATVGNEGQSTMTNVKLEFDGPSGWTINSAPENILRLEPGKSVDFTVEVKPPPDTLAADYYITVTATSDQTEPVSRDLRVTVAVPTGWGYLGVIAIVIIALAVIVIFWKFRRK